MGDGTGGGLDFQAGIFQKLMSEARRHAASMSGGPHGALLRATAKLQRPKSGGGGTKKKPGTSGVGGGGGSTGTSRWWRAALRFLRWDRRDGRRHRGSTTTNANEIEEDKPQTRPNLAHARCTLYFVSADPPSPRCFRPRKRRAMATGRHLRPEGIRKMMVLRKPTSSQYMCLSDLNAAEEERGGGGGRARLIALIARPPPPPPIYWVT